MQLKSDIIQKTELSLGFIEAGDTGPHTTGFIH
jgi:hypothetical protein